MFLKHRWLTLLGITAVVISLISSFAAVPVAADSEGNRNLNSSSAHTSFHVRTAATSGPVGLSPTQIKTFYKLPPSGGSGTIAIIDAYDDPTVAADLTSFAAQFFPGSSPNFEKHMMASSIPVDSGWALEISLDTQWAYAIAPNAKILLVEAASASFTDLLNAVSYAAGLSDVTAISMSWGGGEFSNESTYDKYFTSGHPVAFFASAGDSGAGAMWPASSPNVIGVGGTTLNMSGNSFLSETAWSGSGGGISSFESEPGYQITYGVTGTNSKRAVPDVSYDADPNSGVSVYDSTVYSGYSGWWQVGGTSAGAPQWAAIQNLGLSAYNSNFYLDARSGNPSSYFRDITLGSNGNSAKAGYDLVTGLGSPLTTNFNTVTTPDFTLSASPASQSVLQGNSTSYTVTLNPLNLFSSPVTLSASGLPTGTSASFSVNPTATSSAMGITTSTSTPAGTYTMTISGTGGGLTRATTATLVVTAPGFTISASPSSQTVSRGSSVSYTITIQNGSNVNLSVSGLPNRTSASFTPNPTSSTSTLRISTQSRTSTGTYTLRITGSNGSNTARVNVTLTVR